MGRILKNVKESFTLAIQWRALVPTFVSGEVGTKAMENVL